MDDAILITELNDFIFCPVSIYYHKLYGDKEKMTYQSTAQINGTNAHKTVDEKTYSTKKNVLMSLDVYCEEYNLIGKIDIYDVDKKALRERKKKIKSIYDGYIFQVYAQCFALREMGYEVEKIELYSIDDHKAYRIKLPEDDQEMVKKFRDTINSMKTFEMNGYIQTNRLKCQNCIYEPACDKSILEGEEC